MKAPARTTSDDLADELTVIAMARALRPYFWNGMEPPLITRNYLYWRGAINIHESPTKFAEIDARAVRYARIYHFKISNSPSAENPARP